MPLYAPAAETSTRGDVLLGSDPRDYGYSAWSGDPMLCGTFTVLTTGVQYLMKVWVPRTFLATNMNFLVGAVGATLTAGANNLAIYDSSGTQLCATANQTTNYTATGVKTVPFTAPTSIPGGPGVFVWLAVKSTGTTPVALTRFTSPYAGMTNVSLTAAVFRYASCGTSTVALLPASFTPSSNTLPAGTPFWLAVS